MSLITHLGALLKRNNALAIDQACCCSPCCGLPANCTLCATITFPDGWSTTDCYDQANGAWVNQEFGLPFFMPATTQISAFECLGAYYETQDPKYLSCCVHGEFSETPGNSDCLGYIVSTHARFVCNQCCGAPTNKAIGCRIEDVISFEASGGDNCAQYFPTISFSLECTDENCNPFP